MFLVATCGCKDVVFASVAKFQSLFQFINPHRKVSHGDVRLRHTRESTAQFFLVQRADVYNLKLSTWEMGQELGRNKQMGIVP